MILLRIMQCLSIFYLALAQAESEVTQYDRDFWLPSYHQQRLSYCFVDHKTCGQIVADRYCKHLGYEGAKRATIEMHVGQTAYLDQDKCCRGWRCHGFKLIRCYAKALHRPRRQYYYRLKKFVFPRFEHHRVAWCYKERQACGKPAAYAFCRRMGYAKATQYHVETHIAATRALGDQSLCFQDCQGFANITCYR